MNCWGESAPWEPRAPDVECDSRPCSASLLRGFGFCVLVLRLTILDQNPKPKTQTHPICGRPARAITAQGVISGRRPSWLSRVHVAIGRLARRGSGSRRGRARWTGTSGAAKVHTGGRTYLDGEPSEITTSDELQAAGDPFYTWSSSAEWGCCHRGDARGLAFADRAAAVTWAS